MVTAKDHGAGMKYAVSRVYYYALDGSLHPERKNKSPGTLL